MSSGHPVDPPLTPEEEAVKAEARLRVAQAFNVPLSLMGKPGEVEGCPDCGQDTVVWSEEEGNYCSRPQCGWRP